MKFTDGFWNNKPNYNFVTPQEVFRHTYIDGVLTLYVSAAQIETRATCINQPMLTVEFSSPINDIIHTKVEHFKGAIDNGPQFGINASGGVDVSFSQDSDTITFFSHNAKVVVCKKKFSITYFYKGRQIAMSHNKSLAYIIDRDTKTAYVREQLEMGVGENIYGLGERFTPFVKNGQIVEMWNEDGGTSSEIAYKNIPFYVTSGNYGVFVDNPGKVSFEIASEQVERVQFSVDTECLSYFVICGDGMKQVVQNYTRLTGTPALPPAWSFGLWLTTSFTTSYDEGTVTGFIDGMAQRNLPLHVFHFDCFWMKEFQLCDFEWDLDVFPDPEAMLARYKARGLKICVWINSYVAQNTVMFNEGVQNGYFIKKRDGNVFQIDKWQAGMAVVDFTNPAACDWYKGKLKKMLDMGVDCFKTDFGERIPTDVVYFNNADPIKMHNYYPFLYNKAVYDLLVAERGIDDAVVFARSATAGSQQFPVHWGGDCFASFHAMAESLRGGLSLCLSGFGFWSHDIGGFEATASADVYKRWVAFGLLSSHSRLHGSKSYRVPWLFDEQAVDVLRFFTNLKCSLMPYLYKMAKDTATHGYPMMRAMVLEFSDDVSCRYIDSQYMLGDSFMVAPIFNSDGIVKYYLPHGMWTNFITNEQQVGGGYVTQTFDYFGLPLMVRENSLIAVGNSTTEVDYDYATGVTLHLFNLCDGKEASAEVISTKCTTELKVTATRTGDNIQFASCEGARDFSVILRNVFCVENAEGCEVEPCELGTRLINLTRGARIKLKD